MAALVRTRKELHARRLIITNVLSSPGIKNEEGETIIKRAMSKMQNNEVSTAVFFPAK